jgi:hypothetical protein
VGTNRLSENQDIKWKSLIIAPAFWGNIYPAAQSVKARRFYHNITQELLRCMFIFSTVL